MGAGFCSLYCEIHYIEVRYIKVWVYIMLCSGGKKFLRKKMQFASMVKSIFFKWDFCQYEVINSYDFFFTYFKAYKYKIFRKEKLLPLYHVTFGWGSPKVKQFISPWSPLPVWIIDFVMDLIEGLNWTMTSIFVDLDSPKIIN